MSDAVTSTDIRQAEILMIEENPEGSIKAPPGFLVTDRRTGKLYIKLSEYDDNTGWFDLTTLAGLGLTGNARMISGNLAFRDIDTGEWIYPYFRTQFGGRYFEWDTTPPV